MCSLPDSPPAQGTAAPQQLHLQLQDAMKAIVEQEAEAARLHKDAAALNKAGRFEEAKEMYAKYQAAMSLADSTAEAMAAQSPPVQLPQDVYDSKLTLPPLSQLPATAGGAAAVRRRMIGAVVGAMVGDAASMPLHWVYDTKQLREIVGDADVAFFPTPSCPFYAYDFGRNTAYGDQAHTLLKSIVECEGFSPAHYASTNLAWFGSREYAASAGYLDGSTKGFLRNMRTGRVWPNCGTDDSQVNCLVRLPAVVAAFAGSPSMLPAVVDAIRVTQNTDAAVAWGCAAARVLEAMILGASAPAAVMATVTALRAPWRACPTALDSEIATAIEAAVALAPVSHFDAVEALGRN